MLHTNCHNADNTLRVRANEGQLILTKERRKKKGKGENKITLCTLYTYNNNTLEHGVLSS